MSPSSDVFPINIVIGRETKWQYVESLTQLIGTLYFDTTSLNKLDYFFRNIILSRVEKYVPKATKKAKTNKPSWWSNQLNKAMQIYILSTNLYGHLWIILSTPLKGVNEFLQVNI